MSKAVMISIQPKWCELIASGKKIIEARKTAPKIDTPFKVYIYQTKKKWIYKLLKKLGLYQGKVIGEFVCNKIDTYVFGDMDIPTPAYDGDSSCIEIGDGYFITNGELEQTSLTYDEVKDYGKGKSLFGLHISDLKIYDKPKELGEFRGAKICPDWENDDLFDNTENCYNCEHYIGCNGHLPLARPPQSWQYVEPLEV